MTQTFEEYLENSEYEKIKCDECGKQPMYNSEGHYLCEICARKEYEENKK